jgi:hypothetical protein
MLYLTAIDNCPKSVFAARSVPSIVVWHQRSVAGASSVLRIERRRCRTLALPIAIAEVTNIRKTIFGPLLAAFPIPNVLGQGRSSTIHQNSLAPRGDVKYNPSFFLQIFYEETEGKTSFPRAKSGTK